jgi:hypothetical protein
VLIVIDTTETFQQPLLAGPDWSYVQSLLNRDVARLVVPEIVIAETINHFPAKVTEGLSETRRAIGRLKKIVPDVDLFPPELDVADATARYTDTLRARLNELRALMPEYKQLPIDRIVKRSLQHRKPFDANGHRGLRDAVFWETVLELARTYKPEPIVVITGNTNDFGPHEGLATDLMDDLGALGIDSGRIKICDGLSKFIESHVKPTLDKLDDLQIQIQEQTTERFDVVDFYAAAYNEIRVAVEDHVRHWNFQELDYIIRRFFESPKLLDLAASPDVWDVSEVYRTDADEIAFSIVFTLKGEIECDEIHDHDPMERPWTTEFVGEATFSVETSQVMEESTGQITEFTLESVKIIPGSRWPYDDVD